MALPTRHDDTPPTPATKTVPDEGHPNAADKPWYERPGHTGATDPPAQRRVVKDD